MGKPLTIRDVGSLFGHRLPQAGHGKRSRAKCPLRKHARKDPTFGVFAYDGKEMWKCWSCDSPNNAGDAIKLYTLLASCDNKTAWKRLRDDGFDVPNAERGKGDETETSDRARDKDREAYEAQAKESPYAIPVTGTRPEKVLPLSQEQYERWARKRTGQLERFAAKRNIDAGFMRAHGVVELGGPFVGFTYYDLATGKPCRVKARGIDEKRFWVEPRVTERTPPELQDARALDSLYLANELYAERAYQPVIITEGEPDALAVRSTGILNVVSLPDGSESCKTADLTPLVDGVFSPWFIATDADEAGDLAYEVLRARGRDVDVVRVKWAWLVNDEIQRFKDANDALLAGFTRDDFIHCLAAAAKEQYLRPIDWKVAS